MSKIDQANIENGAEESKKVTIV